LLEHIPPASIDADYDGLSDAVELAHGTDAHVSDTDGDGIADGDEVFFYSTDPLAADTDKDGVGDGEEVLKGLSPLDPNKTLKEVDTDDDGLSDALELVFGSNPSKTDSDGDGFSDGDEIENGYNPSSLDTKPLEKRIAVHIKTQKLGYYLGGVLLDETIVSTGLPSKPTPLGTYTITAKAPRAWSRSAKLWMPWWMNFTGKRAYAGVYALHELPEWPGGKKEGADHLGKPVSHGCIRLGIGTAKDLYDWTPIGTKVTITKD